MGSSRVLLLSLLIFIIAGCGYKPATYYTKKELDGKVFVNLLIDLEDPRNVVIIKDTMNEILVHRLDIDVVDDPKLADIIINLKLESVTMSLVQEDEDGYAKVYKATVEISGNYKKDSKIRSFNVTGSDDFSIDSGTTISDTNRYEGIKDAASKALEEVVSKIAINSFKQ